MSTGRSPVPLKLYDEVNAVDHLYITQVTKHVPVAHDHQLQATFSPRTKNPLGATTGHNSGMYSPKMQARKDLLTLLSKGFTITNEKKRMDLAQSFDSTQRSKVP